VFSTSSQFAHDKPRRPLKRLVNFWIIRAEWHKSSAVAAMGDRLATTDMVRKVRAAVPISVQGAGSPSNTMSPGPRPTSVPTAEWHLDSYSLLTTTHQRHNKHRQKIGGCTFFFWGGGGLVPIYNTMWSGQRSIFVPSGILIHPAVWPEYTDVTDRQTGQTDNGRIAQGEPFCKRFAQKRSRER